MTIHLGAVPASSTLYIPFASYGRTNGESITLTGLATSDIKIFKNGSTTERSVTNGFTLLDTDGVDFDAITGIHGFSIDLADNTDAGFYAVGSFYWVVVSSVTIDGQVVNFIAATFRIAPAEASAGVPKVDVSHAAGTAWASGAITAASIAADAITDAKVASDVTIASVTGQVGSVAGLTPATVHADLDDIQARLPAVLVGGRMDASVGAMAADVVTAAAIATDAIGALELSAGAVAEIQAGLSTLDAAGVRAALGLAAANLDTQLAAIAGFIDTEVAAILAAVDTEVAAIKAKTDGLPASPAAVGSAMTLTAGERDSVAAALLDLAAGVETGRTLRQALRLMLAALAGKASGLATTTATYRDTNDAVDRIVATVDADGNRSAVTLNAG